MEIAGSSPSSWRAGIFASFLYRLLDAAESRVRWLLNWMLSLFIQWIFKLDEVIEEITVERYDLMQAEGISIKCRDCPLVTVEKVEVKVEWEPHRLACVMSTAIVTNARIHWTDFLNSGSEVQSVLSFDLQYPLFLTVKEKIISLAAFRRCHESLQPLDCFSLAVHWLTAKNVKASHRTGRGSFINVIRGEVDVVDVIFLVKKEHLLQLLVSSSGVEFTCEEELVHDQMEPCKVLSLPEASFQGDFPESGPVKLNLILTKSFAQLKPLNLKSVVAALEPFTILIPSKTNTSETIVDNSGHSLDKWLMQFQLKVEDLLIAIGVDQDDCSVNAKLSFNGQVSRWTNKVDVGAVLTLLVDLQQASTQRWTTVLGSDDDGDNRQILVAVSGQHDLLCREVSYCIQINDLMKVPLSPWSVAQLSNMMQAWDRSIRCSELNILDILRELDDASASSLRSRKFNFEIPGVVVKLSDREHEEVVTLSVVRSLINARIDEDEMSVECQMENLKIDNTESAESLCSWSHPEKPALVANLSWSRRTTGSTAFRLVDVVPGNLALKVKEYELLRVLQFVEDIKDLETQPDDSADTSKESSSKSMVMKFSYLEIQPFQLRLEMEPTANLPDELRLLKLSLDLPPQFPPKIEETVLEFGPFVRNNIQYGSAASFISDVRKYYFKELGLQSTKVVGAFHLLGNLSQLKHQVKSSLSQLRETGDVKSFVSGVSQGVTESYLKIRGSWSDYLMASAAQSPPASPAPPDEQDGPLLTPRRVVSRVRGLLGSFTSSTTADSSPLHSCLSSSNLPTIFSPPVSRPVAFPSVVPVQTCRASFSISSSPPRSSPVLSQTSAVPIHNTVTVDVPSERALRTTRSLPCLTAEPTLVAADTLILNDDEIDDDDTDGYVTPDESFPALLDAGKPVVALWEQHKNSRPGTVSPQRSRVNSLRNNLQLPTSKKLLPDSYIKHAKGQEFLRRLKVELGDRETEEKFVSCLTLRSTRPDDKLRAVITSQNVILMNDSSPLANNVVLIVNYRNLLRAQYLESGSFHHVQLVMRASGTRRLSLASRNPADSPLVRCDTLNIARKAVSKINEAKKTWSD